jgi:hypothetical protein
MAEADPASDSSAEALLEQQETTDERRETMPDEEAAKLDLVGLISRMEWRHVMDRVKNTPEETRRKKVISLEGHETKGYPLHLVVSKKPPVSAGYRASQPDTSIPESFAKLFIKPHSSETCC